MSKEPIIGFDSRQDLMEGIEKLTDAVRVTLGPRGRNAVLDDALDSPEITKDGVTVAKELELDDDLEEMGAKLIREVAEDTQDETGDGTTTATLLAHALIEQGLKDVSAGYDPQGLRRGLDRAAREAVDRLRSYSRAVEGRDEIEQIATISANNDDEIGQILAEAMEAIGQDGVITVEEGRGIETELEIVEGMRFDNGYKSPYFVTDQENMVAEFDNPYILIYDDEISSVDEIVDILEQAAREGDPLLIIAEDVDGEALQTLVVNNLKGKLDVAAVKAPGFGDRRQQMLDDIAILTGGELISEEKGMELERTRLEQLGRADSVNITEDDTTIVGGQGSQSAIDDRIQQIERQIQQSDSDYDREKLQKRLARLSGGVAVVHMGAATETEMDEKQARAEDALDATRAAVAEGIVPGGGVVLLRIARDLADVSFDNENEQQGLRILREALEAPAQQIAENAGEEGSVITEEIKDADNDDVGFNARSLEIENLYDAGVIDPAKVARSAIENAASIAGLFLTTEAAVVERPEEDEDSEEEAGAPAGGAPAGGGMPGGMM